MVPFLLEGSSCINGAIVALFPRCRIAGLTIPLECLPLNQGIVLKNVRGRVIVGFRGQLLSLSPQNPYNIAHSMVIAAFAFMGLVKPRPKK